ncbi:MAG: hypothetical protein ACRD6W_07880, partial [Nitrososphaerales archaeon]
MRVPKREAQGWPGMGDPIIDGKGAIDLGRDGNGSSSATGRPLTVTLRRSPRSTRLGTALTSFRR